MTLVRSLFQQQLFPFFYRVFNLKVLKSTSNASISPILNILQSLGYSKFRHVSYFDPASREPLLFETNRIVKDSNRELLEPLYVEPRRFRGTIENPIVVTHMYSVMNFPCLCIIINFMKNNKSRHYKRSSKYYAFKKQSYSMS